MRFPDQNNTPLIKILAPILSCGSVLGISISSLAIAIGLLGIWFVSSTPAPPPAPYLPPTYTTAPTITPTYILPTFMGRQEIPAIPLYPHLVTPTASLLPSTATLTATASAMPTLMPTSTSTATATATPIPIELLSLTSPVSINHEATIKIKTLPGYECHIVYKTTIDYVSIAQGLDPVTADQDGHCSWTWEIGPNTDPGENTITITVGNTSKNFTIVIE